MIKKILFIFVSFCLFIFIYLTMFFDINDYKTNLENLISEKANIELTIDGDIDLDVGIKTNIEAKNLIIKKEKALLMEADLFKARVSISKIFNGIFDIDSISLINSKLYGINIDEKIIQAYNILAGKRYISNKSRYSSINLITARGYFQNEYLYIEDLKIITPLLEGDGFGKINTETESITISSNTAIRNTPEIREKYNEFYPEYLIDTQLPVLLSGSYTNPNIDIKISEIVTKKLKEEIKNRTIESIKDKLKDKIQSEINIKLPF